MRARTALIFLIALAGVTSVARAANPWEFTGGADELKQKEKQYGIGNRWYEDYEAALAALKGKTPNATEAIDRLRLAIRRLPASDSRAKNDQTGALVEYFPYYHLARAYMLQRDYASAQKCLVREFDSQKITGSQAAADFAKLKKEVDALASAGPLLAHADKVLAWGEGQGEVALTPAAAGSLSKIKQLRGGLADPKAGGIEKTATDLIAELMSLLKSQLFERGGDLKDLGREFEGAFTGRQDLVVPAVCQLPSEDRGEASVGSAINAMVKCGATLAKAESRAGQWECEQIAGLRDGIKLRSDGLARWAALDKGTFTAETGPEPPPSCKSFKWAESPAPQVSQELARLKTQREPVRRQLADTTASLDQRLVKKREAFNKILEEASRLIPSLPADCVATLRLETAQRKLEDRRKKLDSARVASADLPATELIQPPAQLVKAEIDALIAGVDTGVQDLVRQKGECEGVPAANLDALPGLLAAYKSGGARPSDLNSLCGKAGNAESDIDTCFEKDTQSVQIDVREYLPLMRVAQAASTLACFPQGAAALSQVGNPPGGNVGPWVKKARATIKTAQSCLATLRDAAEASFGEVSARYGRVRQTLEDAGEAGAGLDPAMGRQIERVRNEVKQAQPGVEKVAALFAQKDGQIPEGVDLKQALTEAGLLVRVPADAWPLLEGAKGRDAGFYAETWRALRDAASGSELARVAERLPAWEKIANNLRPFAALNRALDAFTKGSLDDAIFVLRTAMARGSFQAEGKPAAMAHATLAYFLHTKKLMQAGGGGSGDVTRLLEADVEREAKLAVRADGRVRQVADTLFRNKPFTDYLAGIN